MGIFGRIVGFFVNKFGSKTIQNELKDQAGLVLPDRNTIAVAVETIQRNHDLMKDLYETYALSLAESKEKLSHLESMMDKLNETMNQFDKISLRIENKHEEKLRLIEEQKAENVRLNEKVIAMEERVMNKRQRIGLAGTPEKDEAYRKLMKSAMLEDTRVERRCAEMQCAIMKQSIHDDLEGNTTLESIRKKYGTFFDGMEEYDRFRNERDQAMVARVTLIPQIQSVLPFVGNREEFLRGFFEKSTHDNEAEKQDSEETLEQIKSKLKRDMETIRNRTADKFLQKLELEDSLEITTNVLHRKRARLVYLRQKFQDKINGTDLEAADYPRDPGHIYYRQEEIPGPEKAEAIRVLIAKLPPLTSQLAVLRSNSDWFTLPGCEPLQLKELAKAAVATEMEGTDKKEDEPVVWTSPAYEQAAKRGIFGKELEESLNIKCSSEEKTPKTYASTKDAQDIFSNGNTVSAQKWNENASREASVFPNDFDKDKEESPCNTMDFGNNISGCFQTNSCAKFDSGQSQKKLFFASLGDSIRRKMEESREESAKEVTNLSLAMPDDSNESQLPDQDSDMSFQRKDKSAKNSDGFVSPTNKDTIL